VYPCPWGQCTLPAVRSQSTQLIALNTAVSIGARVHSFFFRCVGLFACTVRGHIDRSVRWAESSKWVSV